MFALCRAVRLLVSIRTTCYHERIRTLIYRHLSIFIILHQQLSLWPVIFSRILGHVRSDGVVMLHILGQAIVSVVVWRNTWWALRRIFVGLKLDKTRYCRWLEPKNNCVIESFTVLMINFLKSSQNFGTADIEVCSSVQRATSLRWQSYSGWRGQRQARQVQKLSLNILHFETRCDSRRNTHCGGPPQRKETCSYNWQFQHYCPSTIFCLGFAFPFSNGRSLGVRGRAEALCRIHSHRVKNELKTYFWSASYCSTS